MNKKRINCAAVIFLLLCMCVRAHTEYSTDCFGYFQLLLLLLFAFSSCCFTSVNLFSLFVCNNYSLCVYSICPSYAFLYFLWCSSSFSIKQVLSDVYMLWLLHVFVHFTLWLKQSSLYLNMSFQFHFSFRLLQQQQSKHINRLSISYKWPRHLN